ncbi:hypothetical protein T492DRAFT_1138318 [Pavlovales sp. CCMP2436]|nr:hypothetical protein T492DRAFT_1138318 [Pavlovales sp. CCMP2436]
MRAALLLALCACAGRAGAVVVGIDFGARFLKVAAIKPGSGIEMVFNEASKRSSSAAVAFNMEDERVLGDDAYNLAPRLPKRTFTYVKNMLGKGHASPADADTTYLVEELAAFILSYAKKISEDHVGAVVRDCVITVPPFWKASERLALMRAAEIAGLNVLSLLHESTAVAFKYGFDKEALFAEKPLNVVFYDVGAASYKGVAWDEDLGGVHFDACVADYLVDSFVKAHPKQGKTLRSSERGMAKIRKEAERIKETLSFLISALRRRSVCIGGEGGPTGVVIGLRVLAARGCTTELGEGDVWNTKSDA